jgi:hypothetical protein
MRLVTSGIVVVSMMGLAVAAARAQPSAPQFSGIKLVDPQNQRGLETDILVRVDADRLTLVDPVSKKETRSFPYSSIKDIEHTYSITPPLPAGKISAASTGATSMPSYLGKEPRHWWTITGDGASATLRVSSKTYDRLKAAVAGHKITIREVDGKK